MHYKNGREAKNGDRVVLCKEGALPVAGVLVDAIPGVDTCNGKIVRDGAPMIWSPDLREVLHADDVALATIPDSTKT